MLFVPIISNIIGIDYISNRLIFSKTSTYIYNSGQFTKSEALG